MSLFSKFYGVLFKSLGHVNQSLVLRNFCNTKLNSCSRTHVDQLRNSSSKKFHIADMKIYEIFREWSAVFANLLTIKL